MVLTPDKFVKTEFGLVCGIILVTLALISLLRGANNGKKKSPTSMVVALGSLAVGGYIIARFQGIDM